MRRSCRFSQQDPIDSEVIHDIFAAAISQFEISAEGAAVTAMRAMSSRADWLINEYSGLRPETQRNCEARPIEARSE